MIGLFNHLVVKFIKKTKFGKELYQAQVCLGNYYDLIF